MEIIGEDMHIRNQPFLEAMEKRDKQALIHFARRQVEAGATAIDINLGHSRKLGQLTPWLVETIQGAMSLPLFLSNHVVRQQRGLEVHRGVATINAVTADHDDLAKAMKTAKYHQTNLVVLLVSSQLTPIDVGGRLQLAMQVLECADQEGLSQRQLYLDPVISCRPDTSAWHLSGGLPDIDVLVESIHLIGELAVPRIKTIVALSNASVCLAYGDRSRLHCRLLPLLIEAGLDAVIMNCRDTKLMTVAKNCRRPLTA